MTISVMLVDDHAVVRSGYRRLLELEPDCLVVAECADGDAAWAVLQQRQASQVDVVVLDLSMPGRSGFELLRRIAQRWPDVRTLVFSMHDSPALVLQAIKAGAAGFVTKSSQPELLVAALRRVAAGQVGVLSPDIAGVSGATAAPAPHLALSSREFQVLLGLVGGDTIDAVAERLFLSAKTVSNHQTQIRHKLGVSTGVELLHYAKLHGIAMS
ncbi:MAG: DNA-binding response regulator [Betaproteobacteria bacterium]|nr:DNA-binding response regulator [Betaproteobacteria bacterium]